MRCVADYASETIWPQSSMLSHDRHDRNRRNSQSNRFHDAPNPIAAADRHDRLPNLAPSLAWDRGQNEANGDSVSMYRSNVNE